MYGSFFEEDHLLNLIILGVYAKHDINVKTECDVEQNLISEKTEVLYAELNGSFVCRT